VRAFLLLTGREDVHGLEVECTNAPHECLLERLLHVRFFMVVLGKLIVRVLQFLAQHIDLLLVRGTDELNFIFNREVKLLLLFLFLESLVLLDPSLEDLPGPELFVVTSPILQHDL